MALLPKHACLLQRLADDKVQAARAALASLTPSSDTTAFDGGKEVMEKLRSQHQVSAPDEPAGFD
jgi:hypothetical protein